MAIHIALHHRTRYTYERPISLGPQTVRLRPAPHCRSRILSYSQTIRPTEHFCNWLQDPHGNWLARLVFPEKTSSFEITVDLLVEMAVVNPFDFFLEPGAEAWPFTYPGELSQELAPFLKLVPKTPKFELLLGSIDRSKRLTNDFVVLVNRAVHDAVEYSVRMEPGVQSPEETLEKRVGSCRDSAWLLVQLFRHLGVAARFVSGYLIQLKPDLASLEGPVGAAKDFTDLHAWTEIYLPGAGWVGLDPTSGLLAGEGHLALAATPDTPSAAPISGAHEQAEVAFDFDMSIQRIHESPRVTKPYTDAQWAAILKTGDAVDVQLRAGDVRLTMGGEPTFVSIDDREGAEWNSTAVGPTKRALSGELLRRLWARYGAGGFLHYGQGKWYPGEPLPRWALSCVWRKDGQPIWGKPALIGDLEKDLGLNDTNAAEFIQLLSRKLGVEGRYAMPAYEDNWYYMWKEHRLPGNVDPLKSKLDNKEERSRLARIFEQGLDRIVGYVMPLERCTEGDALGWTSGPWFLRSEHLFLIPGDSPMGLRLPLDSLPWVAPSDYRYHYDMDPSADLPPLPEREALISQYMAPGGDDASTKRSERQPQSASGDLPPHLRPRPAHLPATDREPGPQESASWIVRTALCVEPRQGNLFVFLPPLPATEDYVDLVAAIEATADELDTPVILEGYMPPNDPRLQVLKITPDPGVIEVNIHPSADWREMVEKTEFLYEAARETRLGTEKFMVDGRHTGTGGGNHIVFGAGKPTDSPFLRRPDLLKSLLAYWHQHPSLSFVFSGLFIGPTSQAPRADEARDDVVYELEIAFRELDRLCDREKVVQPWLVDRIFRDLLTDVTGNTHRAEFCIDKLYSPDQATGRLGLLEMRSFEMPPHARMSLAQQLLVRALIAHFWKHPYAPTRLTRWGTELHDRWMLPQFNHQDLEEIIEDLQGWGFAFEKDWFAPHLEFRFPVYGSFHYKDMTVELRHALEPWHVLGEAGSGSGTVRYVDSSLERMQVKTSGLNGDRYYLTCNGERMPLTPTGVRGEYVAGVRYRAWQPPNCLHPTIEVDTPLTIDLIDSWNLRSVAGCVYHVAHPGGRSHDNFPVNSYEAESRRLARFSSSGHSPGKLASNLPQQHAPDAPLTLDLRRPVNRRPLSE